MMELQASFLFKLAKRTGQTEAYVFSVQSRGSSLECFFHSPSMSGEILANTNETETCNLPQHNIVYTERNT